MGSVWTHTHQKKTKHFHVIFAIVTCWHVLLMWEQNLGYITVNLSHSFYHYVTVYKV